jgi:hypothetical protein
MQHMSASFFRKLILNVHVPIYIALKNNINYKTISYYATNVSADFFKKFVAIYHVPTYQLNK